MKIFVDDNTYNFINNLAIDCRKTPREIAEEILRMVASNEVLLAKNVS